MRPAVLVLTSLFTAACTTQAPSAPPPPPPTGTVFFASADAITAVDGRGAVRSADATVANPDWSRLYAVRGGELVTVTAATNREAAAAPVPPGLTARVVSTAGTLVALTASGGDTYRPAPRTRTRIVVADPAGERPVRELDLAGNFEPEAFSADDTSLFVLEYLPAHAPERYRVRRVELATGTVLPLNLRDKTLVPPGAEEEMRGEGRQAVLAPDRSRLYTLYLHQADHRHTRDLLGGGHDGPQVHAFVHVLSLTEGWAYCLDLPAPFGEHPADTHALTVSPDGRTLYVGELTTKRIAVADTGSLTVTRVAEPADDAPAGPGATLSASPDGRSLYVGSADVVRHLDAATLRVRDVWPVPDPVRGLAVEPDGRHVLVGQSGAIARVDTTTGAVVGTIPAAGLDHLHVAG
jgi:DNA-binding beta-propeller fold protein YncE